MTTPAIHADVAAILETAWRAYCAAPTHRDCGRSKVDAAVLAALKARDDRIESALTKADAVEPVGVVVSSDGGVMWPFGFPAKDTKLYAHAQPAVQSEQVIDLLLAGGFIDKDKLRVAREIIADCKKPAVPVEE